MHFLRKAEAEHWLQQEVGKKRAAVTVKVAGDRLVIEAGGVCVVKWDTLFAPLPERIKVVGPDGKVVQPTKGSRFWVSVETIDPTHLVIEAEHLPL